MAELRCVVFRGLPKEIEEQVNKFFESTPCEIHTALQSESDANISLTLFYEPDPQEEASERPRRLS